MRTPRQIAWRTASTYAAVAAVWILVSGWLVLKLPAPLEGTVEIAKGLGYVAFTSALVYVMVHRQSEAVAEQTAHVVEAERTLTMVMDAAPMGVLLLDARGMITFMNPAAEKLLGATAEQCTGQPLESLRADSEGSFIVSVGELLRTGAIDGLELRHPGSGGVRAAIARSVRLDPQTEGGWVVALADITDAHEAYERSARLMSGYRLLSEIAGVAGRTPAPAQLLAQLCDHAVDMGGFRGAWAVLRDGDGKYDTVGFAGLGEAGAEIAASMRDQGTHKASAAMASLLWDEGVFVENSLPTRPASVWTGIANQLGLGSMVAFAVENGPVRAMIALFAEEERFFDTEELKLVSALKNELSLAFDRMHLESRRLEAEEALAASEATYRSLFYDNPHPMWVRDWDTLSFLAVNDAAVRKYGFSRDEFSRMTVEDLRPDSARAQFRAHMKSRTFGVGDEGIWTHRDAGGREFPVHVMTHEIDWYGRHAEIVLVEEVARVS
jgi:PAS domain S-box-containing protein